MKFTILHESCGRIRIHLARNRMSMREADAAEVYLKGITDIKGVKVYDRTCDAVILYSGDRKAAIAHLAAVPYEKLISALLRFLTRKPSVRRLTKSTSIRSSPVVPVSTVMSR